MKMKESFQEMVDNFFRRLYILLAAIPENFAKSRVKNDYLIDKWQDLILANLISVNYFNSLLVLSSANDFSFTTPAGYLRQHVENENSFHNTITKLSAQMRAALIGARQDLNRVHIGMKSVPDHLKNMALLVKEAPFDLLVTLFPDSFDNIEKLVNESLIVLRKPEKDFEKLLNFLTEIDYLLKVGSVDQRISLQVSDVKAQWAFLSELISELAKQAERTRENFLLQFSWVLQEFLRAGPSFPDDLRDFIISLLLPKMVEIDQTCDVLGMVTKTYYEISSRFTDEQIGGNAHLLLLSQEQKRREYINQFRHDLTPQAVQMARFALKEQEEFLQRDQKRQTDYETFLINTSNTTLTKLIR